MIKKVWVGFWISISVIALILFAVPFIIISLAIEFPLFIYNLCGSLFRR